MGPRFWDAETSSADAELTTSFPGHRGWWPSSAAADPSRAFDTDSYWPINPDGPASEGLPSHSFPFGSIRCCV